LAVYSDKAARDWLRSPRASALALAAPLAAIFASLPAPLTLRAIIRVVALLWMATACLLNARRYGRTHCRYTGPYYLAMMVPAALMGTCVIPFGFYAWLVWGAAIVLGSGFLWWSTERAWGKFS
jgi:hypothetical protein